MIVDLESAIKHLKTNRGLTELRVPKEVRDQIYNDLEDRSIVRPSPRPTYDGPFGDVDRRLWDEMQTMKKLSEIRIYGVRIVVL